MLARIPSLLEIWSWRRLSEDSTCRLDREAWQDDFFGILQRERVGGCLLLPRAREVRPGNDFSFLKDLPRLLASEIIAPSAHVFVPLVPHIRQLERVVF